jgi:hypothetical protein
VVVGAFMNALRIDQHGSIAFGTGTSIELGYEEIEDGEWWEK